jgi:hypothetical protein
MNTVFLRANVLDSLAITLTQAGLKTVNESLTQEAFVGFLLKFLKSNKLKEGVLENVVYSPLRSLFTFGYGGTNDEHQKDNDI